MKALCKNSTIFDKRALSLGFSELILQENAARGVAELVRQKLKSGEKILFLCGGGNNGSDAIACARMLAGDYECELYFITENLNANAQAQLNIALKVGVNRVSQPDLTNIGCVIDGMFGSGLSRDLEAEIIFLLERINVYNALKIAIDFPSGLDGNGNIRGACFKADFTLAMGALKIGLFSDAAKDMTGEVSLVNLGLSDNRFITHQEDFLLERTDLNLPSRTVQNVNKGSFGHAFVALGQMQGAGIMSATAALMMGTGKVSVVGKAENLTPQIMQKNNFTGASAVAIGMGLGNTDIDIPAIKHLPCVLDADLCYRAEIREFLPNPFAVFTPHPKEFSGLLRTLGLADISIEEVAKNRFELAREFSRQIKGVLLLKGANPIIAHNGILYLCNLGSNKLSVGGSGDVLAGIILGYLAQGFTAPEAAKNAVLAHAKSAENYQGNDYSMTPLDLIDGLRYL